MRRSLGFYVMAGTCTGTILMRGLVVVIVSGRVVVEWIRSSIAA
jgi:hypothetical protein